ncbi:MAG TPA: ABC transporter permease, partial [Bacteroidia bacterium]|nr:ABC transporter permease [Bacteroidia bacterium]
AAIKKEALILLRDRVGLAVLFLMPMVLIFVMTLIQDSAFKSLNERGIPIIFVDNDKDSLGVSIEQGLRNSGMCTFNNTIDGKTATAEMIEKAVSDGKFLVGIVVPKGATEAIRNNVQLLVQQTLGESDSLQKQADSVEIVIYIDPITKKSFLTSVTSSLREFISEIKTKIMFQTFSDQISELIPDKSNAPKSAFSQSQIIKYKEVYASKQIGEIVPNAVQHNVPAWAIFAMFFIVLPLAGSMVKEKSEGSVLRLQTMPTSFLILINGKIAVYILVCLIQLILMLSVGKLFLPMLGLPTLVIGNSIMGIILLSVSTAFAATGYGVMMGTIARTEQQGAIMGSLSVLLLSAIGGVWVPTYVMPELMRDISVVSPLNWALNGFYELFLRGGGVADVALDSLKLIVFFILTLAVSLSVNKVKRKI